MSAESAFDDTDHLLKTNDNEQTKVYHKRICDKTEWGVQWISFDAMPDHLLKIYENCTGKDVDVWRKLCERFSHDNIEFLVCYQDKVPVGFRTVFIESDNKIFVHERVIRENIKFLSNINEYVDKCFNLLHRTTKETFSESSIIPSGLIDDINIKHL